MSASSYRLPPQRVDFIVQQWVGHDGHELEGFSHRTLDDLFIRHCELDDQHPGVSRRVQASKRQRLTAALEHANAAQLSRLIDSILLMLPRGSAEWRTLDREVQIRAWADEIEIEKHVEQQLTRGSAGSLLYPDHPKGFDTWESRPIPQPLPQPSGPSLNWPTSLTQPMPHESTASWTPPVDNPPGMLGHQEAKRDFFVSHAGEDKAFVRELVDALQSLEATVWFDEHELMVGDSLSESIAAGLKNSHLGVVVLSKSFFKKKWPRQELKGLLARERAGDGAILPIWHQVTEEDIIDFDPSLVDKVALDSSSMTVSQIAESLCRRLRRSRPQP